MLAIVIHRLLWLVPILIGVTLVSFTLLYIIPGDPVLSFVGERASAETVEQLRRSMGLDQSLLAQYRLFVRGLVRGDLGVSYRHDAQVAPLLWEKLRATLRLASLALVFAVLVGVASGLLAVTVGSQWTKRVIVWSAMLITGIPVFLWAVALLWVFSIHWSWFPSGGAGSLRHLILPAICLGTRQAALICRLTYQGVSQVLGADYIRTARAKGLSPGRVIVKHGLRNALLPIITVIGVDFASLLNGSVLTESVFSYPGLGRFTVTALIARDLPVIQGVVLLSCLVFIAVNLLVDLLYVLLDPRVRYQ